MPNGHIRVDVSTVGWPPTSHFVELSEPLQRFDPQTGAPTLFNSVVVCVKGLDVYGAAGAGVDVFPAEVVTDVSDDGVQQHSAGFVNDTMTPIAQMAHCGLYAAIKQLGYDPTD